MHATKVTFYYARFLVEADGNVRVRMDNGVTMRGDAFSMDLKLNRFVLAGHVHLQDRSGSQDGAALSDFLDFDRIYFLPLVHGSGMTPDRWTFVSGDFAHPDRGRVMPGDVFELPDLSRQKPYLYGTNAEIGARSFVRFSGNHLDILNGLGAYIPTPSYYINYSADQHLGTNSLAGANFDATWSFAGNANSISALHFRYDTINKAYLAFEQHLSGSKAYAVFSLNPMTRPNKFWDLILSDQPSDHFQIKTFTQLNTFQHWLGEPSVSSQFTIVQATQAFNQSFLQLNSQFINYSLLFNGGPNYIPSQNPYPARQHPMSLGLTATTFQHRIGHLPLYERLSYGFGYQHNSAGLQNLQGALYKTIWQHNIDGQLFLPSLKLGGSYVETKNYYVNASFEMNRVWNSVPHHIDVQNTNVTLSKMFDAHFLGFLGYTIAHTGDYYNDDMQTIVYPPIIPIVKGVPYPGYAAFAGVATLRTLSLDLGYVNSGNLSSTILVRQHTDFPQAYPGLFQTPITNVIGQEIQPPNYIGEPPYDATFDVRARVNPYTTVDVSRSYYFNFANRGWSPEFVIQITQ